jgi:hypothetical protein
LRASSPSILQYVRAAIPVSILEHGRHLRQSQPPVHTHPSPSRLYLFPQPPRPSPRPPLVLPRSGAASLPPLCYGLQVKLYSDVPHACSAVGMGTNYSWTLRLFPFLDTNARHSFIAAVFEGGRARARGPCRIGCRDPGTGWLACWVLGWVHVLLHVLVLKLFSLCCVATALWSIGHHLVKPRPGKLNCFRVC